MNDRGSFEKAKQYCFLLLKFRLRSEKEVRARLKKKKFSEPIIEKTVNFLKEKRFLDDQSFTTAWVESRIKKGLGSRRIRSELNLKGIDRQLIEEELSRMKQGDQEERNAYAIARKRLSLLKSAEPKKARAQLYAYLMRRGFPSEIIINAIDNLCRQTE